MAELVKHIDVKVIAMGNGWQTIELTFDETRVGFLASYIGDCPLSSLITLVAKIDEEIQDGETPFKHHIEWFQEPGVMQLIIDSDGTIDDIIINRTGRDMLGFDFNVDELKDPEDIYHFKVRHEDLRNAVVAEGTSMLKDFGLRGYNDNWNDGPDNFPVAAFLLLLGNEVTYSEEDEVSFSRLDKEIDLLKSIL
ncbi:MAG: hypothetical protein IKW85_01620 [Muribaculaceae bacterium]|nr:hypothetical protein [Muribaculaceae bacterium]